jgi:hypothetical protein
MHDPGDDYGEGSLVPVRQPSDHPISHSVSRYIIARVSPPGFRGGNDATVLTMVVVLIAVNVLSYSSIALFL